jgi:hypothetical protein
MNYDQACDAAVRVATASGYHSIDIMYHGNTKGPGRYVMTAKSPNANNIRVTLASCGSYVDMYNEAREYLTGMSI